MWNHLERFVQHTVDNHEIDKTREFLSLHMTYLQITGYEIINTNLLPMPQIAEVFTSVWT